MTTKQVLKLTATFLGKEDLLSCPYFSGEEGNLSETEEKELDLMLRCLNLIVSEISTDYLPIYNQKQITFTGNSLNLDSIDTNIFQITSLKDEYGNNVRFKILANEIKADVKNATITYTSFANDCTLDGEIDVFSTKIPDRVFAYGTAMEYSFISSLFDDAEIWESRYKNALLNLSHKKHNIIMPKRRWF